MRERKHVGDANVQCPECDDVISVPVYAKVVLSILFGQDVLTSTDATPILDHNEEHASRSTDG